MPVLWNNGPKLKYRNQPTTVDGIRFASKGEAARYAELKLLSRAGAIRCLRVHPKYRMVANGRQFGAMELDFFYIEVRSNGTETKTFEDFKGYDNALSRYKRQWFEAVTGRTVRITGKSAATRRRRLGRNASRTRKLI